MDEGLMTTKEAAEYLGVTPARVRQYMMDGRLVGRRATPKELEELKESERVGERASGASLVKRLSVEYLELSVDQSKRRGQR